MEELLTTLVQYRMYLQMAHWQTDYYSMHKATDGLLKKLTEKIDKIIEVYQGDLNKRVHFKTKKLVNLVNTSDKKITDETNKTIKYLEGLRLRFSLANIRDEIVAEMQKFLYLSTFK